MFNLFKDLELNSNVIGLTNELQSIYVYNTFEKTKRPILLVASTIYEANNIYQSLSNYTNSVLLFPMDDFLTGEALAISPEFKTTRLETLNEILEEKEKIVVTNLMGYLRYLPTKKEFINKKIYLKKNEDINQEDLLNKLVTLGYERNTIINKTGEFAKRGFVIDIFPISYENPIRIEFWGNTVESIRCFDINTQLTISEIDEIVIDPNNESNVNQGSVLDYLNNPIVVFNDYNQLISSYKLLTEEIINYNKARELDKKYMFDFDEIKYQDAIYFSTFDNEVKFVKNKKKYVSKDVEPFGKTPNLINKQLNSYKNKKVVIALTTRYKVNNVIDELENEKLVFTNESDLFDGKINLIIKKIQEGFEFEDLVLITEAELFHKKISYSYKTNFRLGTKVRDISKLSPGDYIVHAMYGIGKYLGIKTLAKNGLKKDYLEIAYKDQDKLYIPVEKIDLLSKYSSKEGVIPKVSKLGSIEWEKTKLRVKKKIEDITEELLKLYATREQALGFSYEPDTKEQYEFERSFQYEETPDQLKAIIEVKKDMESTHPMDRLLCGDVGYGKTEIAFRAIFKAIMSGKQVAMLCPTTILSRQHYNNALERFKDFPINIALLNRFISKKETTNTIKKLKEGKIDIVFGTHRLLSSDIEYKDLGLLIIDEEQRFGVKHKEKIKEYKNNIDVLTLSATPIPRTLQMALSGIRSLSLIETPPVNRYPIQTYVLEESSQIIKDAIYKELSRNGQTYILLNNIAEMDGKLSELRRLVPEARIVTAHGKMAKEELEDVMLKFINYEYDVLLCTTIIETGIDIPNVNTLIIYDADHFGLSQLYQIRGRVGRTNKIAYAYLLYNKYKVLSEIAVKRLKVIKDFTELGSGFAIATRDLSLRGAGDILGSEQAGFVDSVGIELFMSMLDEQIKFSKGLEQVTEEDAQPLVDVETTIDNKYIEEEELKIEIHKKINLIKDEESLLEIKNELTDRFGPIPDNVLIYMYEELFDNLARGLNITRINQTKNFIEVTLEEELLNSIGGKELFYEISALSKNFRFKGQHRRMLIILDIINLDKHFIYYLISLMKVIKKCKKESI